MGRFHRSEDVAIQAGGLWAHRQDMQLFFIEPVEPQQNTYIESFNGKIRDQSLNEHWFVSMHYTRTVIKNWRKEYNDKRPYSSTDYLISNQFAHSFLTVDTRANRTKSRMAHRFP